MHFSLTSLAALAGLAPLISAHMEMKQPYAIRSKFNPANQATQNIDYSMTSPLLADGSNYPCKGYQNDRPFESVATYSAGSTYQLELAGSATHNGGSCQLSLSYDNGKTFRVIKSMIGGCPLTSSYDFTIPDFAPNGTALFAWSWQNHSGNREFYMNCAEVDIVSSAPSASKLRRARNDKARRDTFTSFDQLPGIWQANMPPQNDCTTTEGEDPVYPNPGPEVEYGSGLGASSPATAGTCDSLTPPGPTYKDLSTDSSGSQDGGSSSPAPTPVSSQAASSFSPIAKQVSSGAPVFGTVPASSAATTAATTAATSVASSAATSAVSSAAASAASSAASSTPTSAASSAAPSSAKHTPTSKANAPSSAKHTPTSKANAPSSVKVPTSIATSAAPSATPISSPSGGDVAAKASCSTDGSFGCMRSGQGFAVCDHSAWVDMGSVAAGTICTGAAGSALIVADMDVVKAVSSGLSK